MTRHSDPFPELKSLSFDELKARWSELFQSEPPFFNRRTLEARLVYRLQELQRRGLSPRIHDRLITIANELDGGDPKRRRQRVDDKPVAGTRLIREWKGIDHEVTVLRDGYEYQGRRYKSLSAIAHAITGSRWNGWSFFGLSTSRGRR